MSWAFGVSTWNKMESQLEPRIEFRDHEMNVGLEHVPWRNYAVGPCWNRWFGIRELNMPVRAWFRICYEMSRKNMCGFASMGIEARNKDHPRWLWWVDHQWHWLRPLLSSRTCYDAFTFPWSGRFHHRPGPVAIGRNAVSEDGIYIYIFPNVHFKREHDD